ncbi:MAG: hypothetical protein ACLFNS_14525 [Desulfobacterales bacterium]
MKYSNKDIIRSGERKLIRFIGKHLDWTPVRQAIREHYEIDAGGDLEHQSGSIVVHRGDIAYKLDFDLKVNFSVLLDRNGEAVAVQSPQTGDEDTTESPEPGSQPPENARKASEIAEMMSEINKS